MKRGGCKFEGSKTEAVLCPNRGAVVSQLVLKLKESVPPPPGVKGNRKERNNIRVRKKVQTRVGRIEK